MQQLRRSTHAKVRTYGVWWGVNSDPEPAESELVGREVNWEMIKPRAEGASARSRAARTLDEPVAILDYPEPTH